MQTFMQSIEYRIGNYRQPLYNKTNPNEIHYSLFHDDIKDENVDLPYGDDLINVKVEKSLTSTLMCLLIILGLV